MSIGGYGSTKLKEQTVASADSITANAEFLKITGSTTINTILSQLALNRDAFMLWVVATDGAVALGTSGNILVGQTLAQNRVYALIYSNASAKWFIHGVA